MKRLRSLQAGLLTLVLLALSGCQTAYYSAWETFGVEKRDILVDRVESAKDAQEDAQQQFSSALEELSELIQFDGGELERVYDGLKGQYDDSKAAADQVTARINNVERVAEDLFDEWNDELALYKNAALKSASAQQLRETQRQYSRLISAMRGSERRMQPVLDALQDNTLYLKHNLNANAIGALKGELRNIQRDVELLLSEMNQSIDASNQFIKGMQAQ